MKFIALIVTSVLLGGCQTVRKTYEAMIHPTASPRQLILQPRWVRSTLGHEYNGYRRLNRMTPMIVEDQVIVGNGVDGIAAYNRVSGHLKWRFDVRGGVEAGAQLMDDRLFFGGNDGFFYCIDVHTGVEVWRFSIRFEGLGAPLVRGGRVYFLAGNNVAYALDAATGKQLWTYARAEGASFTVRGGSQPSLYGQTLYLGFSDGALVALSSNDGSLQWERQLSQTQRFKDVDASPILDGDHIYVANYDGTLYCLSRSDGQIVWRFDEGSAFAVTVDSERLYFASTSKHLVSLNKANGRVLWSEDIKTGLPTQPALYRGFLVVASSDGPLELRRTQDGQVVSSYSSGRGVAAPPSVHGDDGEIYMISNEANLFAMKLELRNPRAQMPWEVVL